MWHQVCLPLCVYRKTFFQNHADADLHVTHSHWVVKRKFYIKNLRLKKNPGIFPFYLQNVSCAKYDRKINKLFCNNVLAVHFDTRNSRNLQVTKINFYGSVASIIRQERIFLLTTHNHSTINIAVKSCTTFNRFTIKNSWNIQLSKVCSKIDSPYDKTEWTPYCVLLQSWCNWILENK